MSSSFALRTRTAETEESRLAQHISKAQRLSHRPVPGEEKSVGADEPLSGRNGSGFAPRKPAGGCHRRLAEAEKFEEIFEQLVQLRQQIDGRRF